MSSTILKRRVPCPGCQFEDSIYPPKKCPICAKVKKGSDGKVISVRRTGRLRAYGYGTGLVAEQYKKEQALKNNNK